MRNRVVRTLSAAASLPFQRWRLRMIAGPRRGPPREPPRARRPVVRLGRRLAQGWAVWPVGRQPARTGTA
jgi:hypothetical protein